MATVSSPPKHFSHWRYFCCFHLVSFLLLWGKPFSVQSGQSSDSFSFQLWLFALQISDKHIKLIKLDLFPQQPSPSPLPKTSQYRFHFPDRLFVRGLKARPQNEVTMATCDSARINVVVLWDSSWTSWILQEEPGRFWREPGVWLILLDLLCYEFTLQTF